MTNREELRAAVERLEQGHFIVCWNGGDAFELVQKAGHETAAEYFIAVFRALLSALEAADSSSQDHATTTGVALEWRPIDSAPRDGTAILCFNAFAGVYSTAFTTWFEHDENLMRKPGYEGFPCGYMPLGRQPDSWNFGRFDCQPTHWMPLPPPPGAGE